MLATKIYLRITVLWSCVSIGAVILFGLLTLALSNSSFDASLGASAYAQNSQVRQFAVAIQKRKVAAGADVIRVTQGDSVQIVLTVDEAAEVHCTVMMCRSLCSRTFPAKWNSTPRLLVVFRSRPTVMGRASKRAPIAGDDRCSMWKSSPVRQPCLLVSSCV